MNKHLTMVLSAILLTAAIYIILENFYPARFMATCPITGREYSITYGILISLIYFLSAIYTTVFYIFFDLAEQKTLKAYKKEYEKNSISKAEKDSKIQALENKVKTLETALNSMINKKG